MSLTAKTRLGPYEVLTLLGVGGMSEVYRARDTRLDRDVAIKVLAATAIADADLGRALLETEAHASTQPHDVAVARETEVSRVDVRPELPCQAHACARTRVERSSRCARPTRRSQA